MGFKRSAKRFFKRGKNIVIKKGPIVLKHIVKTAGPVVLGSLV